MYMRTYVHTNVQKVDQNTVLNDTGVNLLTETTTTANATKIGNVLYACVHWKGISGGN